MAFFNEFPHTRTYDNDLGWIIKTIKELEENLQNFIKLNTVKYADPIQWDISNQYESNTVVIDDLTGVAYISTHPVPSGVNINNTDYWTPVFTLDLVNLNKNITLRNDGDNHNATFTSVVGDWVIVGGQLYKVIKDIGLHTAYVVGFNIEIYTVELFVKDYLNKVFTTIGDLQNLTTADKTSVVNAINETVSKIGKLDDLTTTDKTSVVNAINETVSKIGNLDALTTTDKTSVVNAINETVHNTGDLANLDTTDKTSIVNAINEIKNSAITSAYFATPQDYGAVGDGVADDTTAITNLFAKEHNILIPEGVYRITSRVVLDSDQLVIGQGNAKIKIDFENTSAIKVTGSNVKIVNLTIEGIKGTPAGSEYNHAIYLQSPHDVTIMGCTFKNLSGDGVYIGSDLENEIPDNVIITNCTMSNCGRNGISIIECDRFIIDSCIIEKTSGNDPQKAIDIEPNRANFVIRGIISNVTSSENVNGFLSVYLSKMSTFFDVKICNCISDHEGDAQHNPITVRNDVNGQVGYLTLDNVSINRSNYDAFYVSGFTKYLKLRADLYINRLYGENAILFWAQSTISDQGFCDIKLHLNQPSGSFKNVLQTVSNPTTTLDNFMLDYISTKPFTKQIESHHNIFVKMPYDTVDIDAEVDSSGNLVWSSTPIIVSKLSTGVYQISGLANVKCAYVTPKRGGVVCTTDYNAAQTNVTVTIFNPTNLTESDNAFFMHIKCSNTTLYKTFDDSYYKI